MVQMSLLLIYFLMEKSRNRMYPFENVIYFDQIIFLEICSLLSIVFTLVFICNKTKNKTECVCCGPIWKNSLNFKLNMNFKLNINSEIVLRRP